VKRTKSSLTPAGRGQAQAVAADVARPDSIPVGWLILCPAGLVMAAVAHLLLALAAAGIVLTEQKEWHALAALAYLLLAGLLGYKVILRLNLRHRRHHRGCRAGGTNRRRPCKEAGQ
jgi:hypothetical protein